LVFRLSESAIEAVVYSKSLFLSLFWMVTSNTRKIIPGFGLNSPSAVFFTAELTVTLKPPFGGVPVVVTTAVGADAGASVVTRVSGTVVGFRVCAGVVTVGEVPGAEVWVF